MTAEGLFRRVSEAWVDRASREAWAEIERWREYKARQSYELGRVRERARREHDDAMMGMERGGAQRGG